MIQYRRGIVRCRLSISSYGFPDILCGSYRCVLGIICDALLILLFLPRWNDKFCSWLPLGLHLSWPYLQEETCSRSHLQSLLGPDGDSFFGAFHPNTMLTQRPVYRNHRSRFLRLKTRRCSQETPFGQISQALSYVKPCSDRCVVKLYPLPCYLIYIVSRGMG